MPEQEGRSDLHHVCSAPTPYLKKYKTNPVPDSLSQKIIHDKLCVCVSALTLCVTQGLVDELCSWEEVLADVKPVFVHCRDIVVSDAHALVIFLPWNTDLYIKISLTCCSVQDVSNTHLLQFCSVQCCLPAGSNLNQLLIL